MLSLLSLLLPLVDLELPSFFIGRPIKGGACKSGVYSRLKIRGAFSVHQHSTSFSRSHGCDRVPNPRLTVGQFPQRIPGEPVDGPLVHGRGVQGEVEVDTGLVPVQAGPFQPAAAAFHGNLCQLPQKGFPIALTSVSGLTDRFSR